MSMHQRCYSVFAHTQRKSLDVRTISASQCFEAKLVTHPYPSVMPHDLLIMIPCPSSGVAVVYYTGRCF